MNCDNFIFHYLNQWKKTKKIITNGSFHYFGIIYVHSHFIAKRRPLEAKAKLSRQEQHQAIEKWEEWVAESPLHCYTPFPGPSSPLLFLPIISLSEPSPHSPPPPKTLFLHLPSLLLFLILLAFHSNPHPHFLLLQLLDS